MTNMPAISAQMRALADLSETPIHSSSQARGMWHAARVIVHDIETRMALEEYETREQFSETATQILDHLRELF